MDKEELFTYKWGMELLQTIPFKSKVEESLECGEKIYSYVWETRFLSISSEINAAQFICMQDLNF